MILISNDSKYMVQPENCRSGIVSGEYVVYFVGTKKAIVLNKTGSFVWNILSSNESEAEVYIYDMVKKLMVEFGAETNMYDKVYDDMLQLLTKLKDNGFITMEQSMSKPALSIILPVYNVEPYIRECIDSILSQSYIDFELIIIDDQSTDNSADICAQYQKTDDRIRLFHNVQNLGLSETRNIGIEKAQGEYLSFIDSDDYIGTGMYSDMISKIIENDADICMCNYFWVDENGQQMSQYISENSGKILIGQDKVRENILTHNNCVWNKLFKKRLFSKIKFPEGKVFEDIFIMHELFESADRVYITEGSFYYYRRRKQSITARPFQISNFDLIDAVIAKYLFVKDGYETDIVESSAEFVLFNFVYCVNRIISEDKVKQFKEKVKEYSIIINKLGVVLSSDNNDLNTAYKLIAKDIRLYQFAVMK